MATAPIVTVVSSTASSVTLTWTTGSSTTPIIGYRLDSAIGGGALVPLFTTTGFGHTATGLIPGVSYAFRVTALYAGVDGPVSDIKQRRTDALTVPAPAIVSNIPCLNYREFTGSDDNYQIDPNAFEANLRWLNEHGYKSYTFDAFQDLLSDPAFPANLPSRPVLIFTESTKESFYNSAYPLLETYGHVATIGLRSGDIDLPSSMTAVELNALAARGFEFASLAATPIALTTLNDAQQNTEIVGSKSVLTMHGLTIRNFIYPYGDYDPNVISKVVGTPYRGARATGGSTIAHGGYASFDLGRRFEMGCATMVKTTTLAEFEGYMLNTKVEVEDLYVVKRDVGIQGPIERWGEYDMSHGSYGGVKAPDQGDTITFKIIVNQPGVYDLKFHVQTGTPSAPLSSTGGYSYKMNGRDLRYTESGPTAIEHPDFVWGYHTVSRLPLPAGVVEFELAALRDWQTTIDSVEITP